MEYLVRFGAVLVGLALALGGCGASAAREGGGGPVSQNREAVIAPEFPEGLEWLNA